MVKFIGGPSINAYKNYRNHTIARPGQFRMPRNYGRMSTRTTIIMNGGNTCHRNYGCGWGYGQSSLMGFMNLMPMIGSFFTNLFGLFAPKQPAITQNQNNNIFADNKPVTTTKTYTPTSRTATATPVAETKVEEEEDNNDNQNIEATGSLTYSISTTQGTENTPTTVEVKPNEMRATRISTPPEKEGLWAKGPLMETLAKSYIEKGSSPERRPSGTELTAVIEHLRANVLGNNHIFDHQKTQHFPAEITVGGKTYTFDKTYFIDKNNWQKYEMKGTQRVGNAQAPTPTRTPGTTTTTYKGSITVAGKTYQSNGKTKADDVKNDLKSQLLAAKENNTITEAQYNAAIEKVNSLTPSQE